MAPPAPSRRPPLRLSLTRGAKWIVGLLAASWLVWLFGGEKVQSFYATHLALSAHGLFAEGRVWQLLTAPLVYPDGGAAVQLILDAMVVWLMTPTLERWWGTRRFLRFAVATALFGTAVGAAAGLVLGPHVLIFGLGPFVWGVVVAYGVLFARQKVQLFGAVPVEGRSLAIGAAALMLLMVLVERQWVSGAASFGGMGLAYVLTSGFTPNLWLLRLRRLWARRRFGVVDGGPAGGRGKKKDEKRWMN
jgi:hypothetical protein